MEGLTWKEHAVLWEWLLRKHGSSILNDEPVSHVENDLILSLSLYLELLLESIRRKKAEAAGERYQQELSSHVHFRTTLQ